MVCETAGEASTLSPEEQSRLIRAAAEVARGGARVIAGAGSNSTSQAIELTRRAEAAGADAVLSVVPYYNKPMQAGIEAHFLAVADSTKLPIILHDIPSRTTGSSPTPPWPGSHNPAGSSGCATRAATWAASRG